MQQPIPTRKQRTQALTHARVLIFGATGATGRLVVEEALARGHEVTAFSRDPSKLELRHSRLRRVAGDVLDAAAVRAAVRGHDAVVCALGMPLLDASRLRARGTRRIVAAMEAEGVSRLVCLSVLGLGESWANLPWTYRYLLFPLVFRRVAADHDAQEEIVRASELDWTLVRPPNLSDAPASGAPRHGFSASEGPVAMAVARADVAAFMAAQIESRDYSRACPGITA